MEWDVGRDVTQADVVDFLVQGILTFRRYWKNSRKYVGKPREQGPGP